MNKAGTMRFTQKSPISKIKNDLYGTGGGGDSAELNIHFNDEKKSFLFDDNKVDNELKRKDGN